MELQSANEIIDALAKGVHPVTGEAMSDESPYLTPAVVQALTVVSQALLTSHLRPRREAPPNAGKAWAPEDDAQLQAQFAGEGQDLKPLAIALGRTPFAVESRLIKLGKLPARIGRFGPPGGG